MRGCRCGCSRVVGAGAALGAGAAGCWACGGVCGNCGICHCGSGGGAGIGYRRLRLRLAARALTPGVCGRIMPQPSRMQRHAPLEAPREGARHLGHQIGKLAKNFGGGRPVVSVAGHTTTAPFSSISRRVTFGRYSGAEFQIEARPRRRGERNQRRDRLIAADDLQRLAGAALEALGEELPDVLRRPPDPQIDREDPRLDHHRERDQHRRQDHQRGPGIADHVLMLDADAVAGRDDHRKPRHRRKRRRHEVLRPRAEQREQPHRQRPARARRNRRTRARPGSTGSRITSGGLLREGMM